MLAEVFETGDRQWRGIGMIPASGWNLAPAYSEFDASRRFDVSEMSVPEPSRCRAGEVLQGLIKPSQCECFGVECTPRNPLGAPMVSGEGPAPPTTSTSAPGRSGVGSSWLTEATWWT